ncbi:MAG TPA: aminotransferase class I/II-fold pyridoxal phosphate-dependent enzyme [Pirellulaceae bacterium]|nr:aminotransferase class I/II-fold pyridoxal phosphate-dependent enzyme [Pirellulaceae bacterium]
MPRPEDVCPRPQPLPPLATTPHAPPIWPASVWECESPQQADAMLGGQQPGYVYQRDGHPNAWLLAEKCRQLHGADRAAIAASGMGALAAALLSQLKAGDHCVVGGRVYGKTHVLFGAEASRLGIEMTTVDTCDLKATAAAFKPNTKLLLAETIANPLLEVADIAALAEIAHSRKAALLIDNTFASPILCRPLELGADLVMESLTKTMNGHSDVVLGLLCGREAVFERVPAVISAWGLSSSPFDCWLADRGLATAHLRIERACDNAFAAAEFLHSQKKQIERVFYPGLSSHAQHALAKRQFMGRYGTIVSFNFAGGRPAADAFIAAAKQIPFCPSLGELSTTLSHPETTSHRGLSADERAALGITGGTIRLSVGTESNEFIQSALQQGL